MTHSPSLPIETAPTGIEIADLCTLSRGRIWIELAIPLPWLLLSLWLYAGPLWPLGAGASFLFFLCCLRLNHEAIHGNLGAPRWADHAVMHGLSALMLGSNHADACCHLAHHRDTMGDHDHEGHCAKMTLTEVLLYGPRFPLELNRAAWAAGPRWRRRVAGDWLLVGGSVALVAASGAGFLWLHLVAMALGQCLAAFFAVWITHQGTEGTGLAGRSQRGPLAFLAYHMFYHREHHLFPRVPVSRLPELARRLDTQVPGYAAGRLPVLRALDR